MRVDGPSALKLPRVSWRLQYSAPSCTLTLPGQEITTREQSWILYYLSFFYSFDVHLSSFIHNIVDSVFWYVALTLQLVFETHCLYSTSPFDIQMSKVWLSIACILLCHSVCEVIFIEYCTCYLNRKKGYRIIGGSPIILSNTWTLGFWYSIFSSKARHFGVEISICFHWSFHLFLSVD